MEKALGHLIDILQKLIGHHRRLLELVRDEKEFLTHAHLSKIQEVTYSKEVILSSIYQSETKRIEILSELAYLLKRRQDELVLSNLIILVQGDHPEYAKRLQSSLNALNVLIARIKEQNTENKELVEHSLKHVAQMKENAIGSTKKRGETYTSKGYKSSSGKTPNLISKEI